MKLEAGKTIVRHLEEKDMLFIQELWRDENTMLAAGGGFNIKDEDLDVMYSILRNDDDSIDNHFVIETDGKCVGDLSIRNYSSETNKVQIDLKIEYTERTKGYAKEALSLYLDYFFNKSNGEEVYIEFWLKNYFVKEKLEEYDFETVTVTDDIYHMILNKKNYLTSKLNGGQNEL